MRERARRVLPAGRDVHAGGGRAVHNGRAAPKNNNPHAELKEIVLRVPGLPAVVRGAEILLRQDRILDRQLFDTLTSQPNPGAETEGWKARLDLRKKNLFPHMDRLLVCVFFRLPGCHYTFEIDPESNTVVHWEGQPA